MRNIKGIDTEARGYNIEIEQLRNGNSDRYLITVITIEDDGSSEVLLSGKRSHGHAKTDERIEMLTRYAKADDINAIKANRGGWVR